ncbi:hypothetical protein [Corynebacterium lujinxingii]|uniref:Head-to-tail adaptor n=1 Tax=Corynebacterium lujinxingii TaxID=2763010 RepID=A0A7H0K0S9_9CORY|nr:hypothetical protein [Corynebacterium lujinxingii]MBC3179358.1 hypothetical protein [Corynebacterium lujinxingii]NNO11468.1 hypothetical protein [Corynebacterium lujinxingii]QNP90895.1 hypothetical protein IAU68_03780 [Corynebacterium lujinxingii]
MQSPSPPIATPTDVAKRLGRDLDDGELDAVDGLLEEAEVLIEGYLGKIPQPVPRRVTVVASRMVARVLEQPDAEAFYAESVQHAAGPFSETKRFSTGASGGAPWLTAADKQSLRQARSGGRGIYTIGIG